LDDFTIWLAGYLEKSGTISLYNYKVNDMRAIVSITGDPQTIMYIQQQLGFGKIYDRKRYYALYFQKLAEINVLLCKVLPYLRGKKKQLASLMLEYLRLREQAKAISRKHHFDDEFKIFVEMRNLNRGLTDKLPESLRGQNINIENRSLGGGQE